MLDAVGQPVPDDLDGKSFLSGILGKASTDGWTNERDDVYCVFDRHFTVANQRMVRTKTHQFTFNSSDIGELYDLQVDPYQLDNRYDDPMYASVQRDLMRRMEQYMTELGDPVLGWYRRMSPVY
ncbi:DUF4976 domain-containing protein [Chloroflexi bacterium TSY]|nr:DUF4976 domain-containing protein [Chloroflexi bacterium TSY]